MTSWHIGRIAVALCEDGESRAIGWRGFRARGTKLCGNPRTRSLRSVPGHSGISTFKIIMQQQLELLESITIHLASSQELSIVKSKAAIKEQLNVCTQQFTTMNICRIVQFHLEVME